MPPSDDIRHLERHCPRLGHVVRFEYCRSLDGDTSPCFKSLDCWWERFDAAAYFRRRLAPADFQRLAAARPPDKMVSLVELIRQAKQRCSKVDS